MEDLMEQTVAIKTSNMAYPLPCLKNVPKIQLPPKKMEVIDNTKTCFRL